MCGDHLSQSKRIRIGLEPSPRMAAPGLAAEATLYLPRVTRNLFSRGDDDSAVRLFTFAVRLHAFVVAQRLVDDAALERGKSVENGLFASVPNLFGHANRELVQGLFSSLAVVVAVERRADAVVEFASRDDVDEILECVQDFAVLADEVADV